MYERGRGAARGSQRREQLGAARERGIADAHDGESVVPLGEHGQFVVAAEHRRIAETRTSGLGEADDGPSRGDGDVGYGAPVAAGAEDEQPGGSVIAAPPGSGRGPTLARSPRA